MDEGRQKDGLGCLPPRNEEVTAMTKRGNLNWKILMTLD